MDSTAGLGERRKGGKPIFFAFLLCLFCAAVAFTLWWRWANLPPNVSVAGPTLPARNAYDFWLEASAQVYPSDLEVLRTALGDAPRLTATPSPARISAGERKAILARGAVALREFAWGVRYPYVEPLHPSGPDTFAHYSRFLALSRLLRLDGWDAAQKGLPARAVSRGLDGLQMGIEIPHDSPNIGLLTGAMIQREARVELWQYLPRLSSREARQAIARLETLCGRQVPYWRTLEYEKRFGTSVGVAIVQTSGWREDLHRFGMGARAGQPANLGAMLLRVRLATISKTELVRNYTDYMDHLIQVARGPYPGAAVDFPQPSDAITNAMTPVFDLARFVSVKEESLNGLLLLALALHAYRLDHGRYPADLAALAPGYLKQVPADPFDPKAGFRYRLEDKTYRLYSVGPDLQDNDGVPARSRSNRGKGNLSPLYKVDRTSQGDLVPGVNL